MWDRIFEGLEEIRKPEARQTGYIKTGGRLVSGCPLTGRCSLSSGDDSTGMCYCTIEACSLRAILNGPSLQPRVYAIQRRDLGEDVVLLPHPTLSLDV
jgi:hypothetical protein